MTFVQLWYNLSLCVTSFLLLIFCHRVTVNMAKKLKAQIRKLQQNISFPPPIGGYGKHIPSKVCWRARGFTSPLPTALTSGGGESEIMVPLLAAY